MKSYDRIHYVYFWYNVRIFWILVYFKLYIRLYVYIFIILTLKLRRNIFLFWIYLFLGVDQPNALIVDVADLQNVIMGPTRCVNGVDTRYFVSRLKCIMLGRKSFRIKYFSYWIIEFDYWNYITGYVLILYLLLLLLASIGL